MDLGPLEKPEEQYYIDGGNVKYEPMALPKDNSYESVNREYEQRLKAVRHDFWVVGCISEEQYQDAVTEIELWYDKWLHKLAARADLLGFSYGDYLLSRRRMTRNELQEAIEAELKRAAEVLKQSFAEVETGSLRSALGPFGDVADLETLVTEKPKRQITCLDRLRDVLLWLFDWLAPPDEKHKRECNGYPCDCALVDEGDE